MTADRIRAMLEERPFRPFGIHTSDGQVVTVKAPDFAWVHPTGLTMYVCPDPTVDADQVINLIQVTKLTVGKTNGGGWRKRRR